MKGLKNSRKLSIKQKEYAEGDIRWYSQFVFSEKQVSDKFDIKIVFTTICIIALVVGYLIMLNNKTIEQGKNSHKQEFNLGPTPTQMYLDWRKNDK